MRVLTTLLAAATVAAALGTTAAQAATVEVSATTCYFLDGGNATVPAGSDVVFRFGWAENNRGRMQDFLKAQTTTADVNGTPVPNASKLWGPIQKLDKKFYASFWRTSGGTLANPGDSTTLNFQLSLSRAVPEGKDPDTGRHLKAGPGPLLPADFHCTVTAV